MDIYKDYGYRTEDVQHVADTYKVSYRDAEDALAWVINNRKKDKAFPIDTYWENVAKGDNPEKAAFKAVETEGLPSTIVAKLPALKKKEVSLPALSPLKEGIEKTSEGMLFGIVILVVVIGWLLLMGRK